MHISFAISNILPWRERLVPLYHAPSAFSTPSNVSSYHLPSWDRRNIDRRTNASLVRIIKNYQTLVKWKKSPKSIISTEENTALLKCWKHRCSTHHWHNLEINGPVELQLRMSSTGVRVSLFYKCQWSHYWFIPDDSLTYVSKPLFILKDHVKCSSLVYKHINSFDRYNQFFAIQICSFPWKNLRWHR